MAKINMRSCKYKNCKHASKLIDTKIDQYVQDGKAFFHEDCYAAKQVDDEKKKNVFADMQYIKNLWIQNISQTVSIPYLYKVLNEYMDRGIASDYLVFVMEYIVKNHCKLNYPPGLGYYLDREEIKREYKKSKMIDIPENAFKVSESQEEVSESHISVPRKLNGFGSILGGR